MTKPWVRVAIDSRTRIDVVPRFADSVRASLRDPAWSDALFDACASAASGTRPPASDPTRGDTNSASGRAPLLELQLDGGAGAEAILVRRGLRGGWLARLLGDRHASPHRPLRELAASLELRLRGAPVPEPVFAAARRSGLVWRTAFASVQIPNVRDLLTRCLESDREPLARRSSTPALQIAREAGRAIRRFHDCGGSHADLHLGNLIASTEGEKPKLWLVDLDRARVLAPVSAARRATELTRLQRSLRKHGSKNGRHDLRLMAACFDGYCSGDRELRRALRKLRNPAR